MTTVLVASGGGHLQQLLSLVPRMRLPGPLLWATPDTGLSRGALKDSEHIFIPYIPARDWGGALKLTRTSRAILRETGAQRVISTGAAVAPPFFLAGAAAGLDLHYVETATRSTGPSLSGRLVSRVPRVHLYTQYPHLVDKRWQFAGSIFDPFQLNTQPTAAVSLHRIVVSLGTEKFGFRRAVEALLKVLPGDSEVLWQTGATDVTGLPLEGHATIPAKTLRAEIEAADLFISHCGTGSALTAFELGKTPLLLPREAKHGEHIDDHQQLTAAELERRGLAVTARVEDVTVDDLIRAASGQVINDSIFRPFELVGVPVATPAVIDLRNNDRADISE